MRIVGISDLHQFEPKGLPKADVLVIAGDYSFLSKRAHMGTQIAELEKLNFWLATIEHKFKHILFVPGNHDFIFENNEKFARIILDKATVLINEAVEIDGIKFYGSPVQPSFNNWAFNVERGEEINKYWMQIPHKTQVLITHGPPKGILDQVNPPNSEELGCADLFNRIQELEHLKAHFFGHIHGSNGMIRRGNTVFANCSIADESYDEKGSFIVVNI